MIDSDLKMLFLLGKHYKYNDICTLHSLTIGEISEIGFDKYNESIGILCITKDDIDEIFDYELDREIDPFELFFKEPVGICEHGYFFIGELSENRFIESKNYNFIIDVLKQQNCVEIEKKVKPKNEAQKRFMKQRRKMREKYKKKDDGMVHIVSSVCAKHNSYNLLNISKLTMFQLIDQYKRIHAIDDYFITINSMMHGASDGKTKLKHWSESLD
jgi:hypothetical protein